MAFHVPEQLAQAVAGFHEGMGSAWLHELPRLVAACCERWSLALDPPYPYPSLSYAAPGIRAGEEPIVLKVGFLCDELASEIAALGVFDGSGAVRLVDAEPPSGALLLERLQPGSNLVGLPDEEAVSIASSVMRELWHAPPLEHGFPTVEGWCRGFERLREHYRGGTGPFPTHLVAQAETLARDLLAGGPDPMLLHGDLQHFNVLQSARGWLAIDPKGVVGDAAFEPGAFLGNEWEHHPEPAKLMARREDQFAEELSLDRKRVRAWGLVQAVLSAWWHVEDEGACPEAPLARIGVMAEVPQ